MSLNSLFNETGVKFQALRIEIGPTEGQWSAKKPVIGIAGKQTAGLKTDTVNT